MVVIRHMKIIRHASINDDHQRDFVRANDEMRLKCQYILADFHASMTGEVRFVSEEIVMWVQVGLRLGAGLWFWLHTRSTLGFSGMLAVIQ